MIYRLHLLAGCAFVAALGSGAPALAQTATRPSTDGQELEQIVVTARRRAEDIQKVPVAVTAISGEGLTHQAIVNAQDLRKVLPGMNVSSGTGGTGGRTATAFTIRGQGGSFGAGGTGVAVYLAETPSPFVDLFDVQSVQALKGPQGTLFGRVTTGGAVLLAPRTPTDQFEGYVLGRYGDYATRLVEFGVGGPIFGDVLQFRAAGQVSASDGFTRNVFLNHNVDSYDKDSFRLTLRFHPVEVLENTTILTARSRTDNTARGQIGLANPQGTVTAATGVVNGNIRPIPAPVAQAVGLACPGGVCPTWLTVMRQVRDMEAAAGPKIVNDNSNTFGATSHDYTIINNTQLHLTDDLLLKNIFSYNWGNVVSDGDNGQDVTYLPLHEGYDSSGPSTTNRTISEELQLQAELFDDRLQITSGGYFEQNWMPVWQRTLSGMYAGYGTSVQQPGAGAPAAQVAAYNSCLAGVPFNDVSSGYCHNYTGMTVLGSKTFSLNHGAYANAQLKVTDKFRLSGGIRKTWVLSRTRAATLLTGRLGLTSAAAPNTPLTGILTRTVSIRGNPRSFVLPAPQETWPGAPVTEQKTTGSKTTWMVAADYTFDNNIFVYGTIRTGYKPGGNNANVAAGLPLATYGPENVTDYEVGVKGNWSIGGIRGRSSAEFYWDKYSNIQRTIFTGITLPSGQIATTQVVANVAVANIRGFDLETSVALNDWVEATGYFSLTDAKYKKWPNTGQFAANGVPATADLTQNMIAFTSKYRWGVQPALNIVSVPNEIGKARITANIYYQSKFATADLNEPFDTFVVQPAATKMDIRAELAEVAGSQFTAAAGVTNVFDKRNRLGTANLSTFTGVGIVQYAEPRIWYVEGTYRF
jgi:iron complex outermembrane recepter protein